MSRKQPDLNLSQALRLREEKYTDDSPAAEEPGETSLHFRDLIERLLARWHWIALGLCVGLSFGLYQIWRAVPLYQAYSTVLVRDYNISVMGQLDAAEFDLRNVQSIETVRAGLIRYELCEAVASDPTVRELKGLVPPKPRTVPFFSSPSVDPVHQEAPAAPQLAFMIRSWIGDEGVRVRPDTRLIDIVVSHPRPLVAQTIANSMVEHYMKQRTDSRSGEQRNTLDYLVAESERVKTDLQKAQNVLASYSAPLDAEKELAAAETEVRTLKLRYRHKHPRMIAAQARLDQAQELLREFLVRAVQNPFDGEYWTGHRDRLAGQESTEAVNRIRDLLISRRAVLDSEIESQNSLYGSLLSQIERLEVNTKQTDAEVTPQSAALLPGAPVSPRKLRVLLQASAFGLFAGFGLAFLFQYLDNKFHTVAEVEARLNLPVLAGIVEIDEENLEREESRRLKEDPGALKGREGWSPNLVFRVDGANSHYAEMFRVLRTSISLLGPSEERKVTMVTSALPGEGKTLVAANLAVALAQQGFRTLLIDMDLRKPSAHRMFGCSMDEQPGIVDLLAGQANLEQIIRPHTGQENFGLILSGPKAPNPGELLVASRLEKLFAILRVHFDHIVLDTAPLLAVPDSAVLAPLADNLALVVRAERTPLAPARRALAILDGIGVVPEGIVFNGFVERRRLMGKNYTYGYYRYDRQGYGKFGSYGTYGAVYGEEEEEEAA